MPSDCRLFRANRWQRMRWRGSSMEVWMAHRLTSMEVQSALVLWRAAVGVTRNCQDDSEAQMRMESNESNRWDRRGATPCSNGPASRHTLQANDDPRQWTDEAQPPSTLGQRPQMGWDSRAIRIAIELPPTRKLVPINVRRQRCSGMVLNSFFIGSIGFIGIVLNSPPKIGTR